MVVGDDIAITGDDDARARCFRGIGSAEEAVALLCDFRLDLNDARLCLGCDLLNRQVAAGSRDDIGESLLESELVESGAVV